MSHIPTNHRLRPLYRVLAALTAGWLLVFGAIGLTATEGAQWLGRGDWTALGLSTNRALAVASLAAGAVVLLAALVGRNVDRHVNLWAGPVFLLVGMGMLAFSHTDANLLNFSVGTTVASYLIGLVLLISGLYGKVEPAPRSVTETGPAAQPAPEAGDEALAPAAGRG